MASEPHSIAIKPNGSRPSAKGRAQTFTGNVIIGRDVTGAAFPLLGDSCTLGRERGDINFPDDGYVSGLHARVALRDGRVFLADLGSSNGTFIKVNGERAIGHESFVLLGQQLFRVNLA